MPVAPEHRLTDEAETLLRQVHQAFVVEGRVASAAFRPSSQDEGELSVDRGALTSAADALARYVAAGGKAVGTWGVTLAECRSAGVDGYADPLPANDAHALVDFRPTGSKSRWAKVGDKLAAHARARGRLAPS